MPRTRSAPEQPLQLSRWPGSSDVRLRGILPALLAIAFILLTNAVLVARVATISPLDEMMHIDYMFRASRLELPTTADALTQEALHAVACRGHPTDQYPECGARPYDPSDFYPGGRNVAARHSPYYFVVTGVVARLLHAAVPQVELVTWARALGSVWLIGGLALAYAAGRRLRLPPSALLAAGTLVAVSPSVQHAATTINPDATALPAGALVLWLGLRFLDKGVGGLALAAAAIAAMLLDPTNLLAVVAVGIFIVVQWRPSSLHVAAGMVGGLVVAEVAQRWYSSRASVADISETPHVAGFVTDELTGPMVWGTDAILAMMPPTQGYVFPAAGTPAHSTFSAVAAMLVVASLLVGALGHRLERPTRAIVASALAVAVSAAPLLVLMRYFRSSSYFPIPSRYGLSLVSMALLAVAAVLCESRAGRVVVGATAGALGVATTTALI